ncbi:Ubiquitin fusion degradation protein 4 [Mucor circinelloides]
MASHSRCVSSAITLKLVFVLFALGLRISASTVNWSSTPVSSYCSFFVLRFSTKRLLEHINICAISGHPHIPSLLNVFGVFTVNKKAAAVVNRLFDIAKPKVLKEGSTWYSKPLLLKDLSLAILKRIISINYQDSETVN